MTTDERIEKLTERHEAFTQTVGLRLAENRQRDRRMGEVMGGIARLLHADLLQLHNYIGSALEAQGR